MSKKPTEIPPPPPATGHACVRSEDEQLGDHRRDRAALGPAHPDNQQAAADDAPAQTPLKDA